MNPLQRQSILKKATVTLTILLLLIILLKSVAAVGVACSSDEDCEDLSLYTIDECINPSTEESYCDYTTINCANDIDCGMTGFIGYEYCSEGNVFKDFQTSVCLFPGTEQSECDVTVTPTQVVDCGGDSCGEWGEDFCYEGNVYRERTCTDNSCSDGICYTGLPYTDSELVEECSGDCIDGACQGEVTCSDDADCGIDGAIGEFFCTDEDYFDTFRDFTCVNPGQVDSYCTYDDSAELAEDCGEDSCGEWSENYCSQGNDVYKSRECHDKGCGLEGCYDYPYTEDELVDVCDNFCDGGQCVDCLEDADCTGSQVCIEGECLDESCYSNEDCGVGEYCSFPEGICEGPGTCTGVPEICSGIYDPVCGCDQITYSNGCLSASSGISLLHTGACEECTLDQDCGEPMSELVCRGDDVINETLTPTCDQGSCSENIEDVFIETCVNGCEDGQCLPQCEIDDDCLGDYSGDNYCEGNDIMSDRHNFICVEGGCQEDVFQEFVETCELGCLDGECIVPECTLDQDCGESTSELICMDGDVYEQTTTPLCIGNFCEENVTHVLKEECDSDERCDDGDCEQKPSKKKSLRYETYPASEIMPNNITVMANTTVLEKALELSNLIQLDQDNVQDDVPDFNPLWIWIIIIVILIILLLLLIAVR